MQYRCLLLVNGYILDINHVGSLALFGFDPLCHILSAFQSVVTQHGAGKVIQSVLLKVCSE